MAIPNAPQPNQMIALQPNEPITITLPAEQLMVVLGALQEIPYKLSDPVIGSIQRQVTASRQPAEKQPAEKQPEPYKTQDLPPPRGPRK